MPPGQSGTLRLFGIGCAVSFLQVTIPADRIDLLLGVPYSFDIPLPDIDIYPNLSGFAAGTPLVHLVTSMADKKAEEKIETILAAGAPDQMYRFYIYVDANGIPALRFTAYAGAFGPLVVDFDQVWDIWITNCAPFGYTAEAPQ